MKKRHRKAIAHAAKSLEAHAEMVFDSNTTRDGKFERIDDRRYYRWLKRAAKRLRDILQ